MCAFVVSEPQNKCQHRFSPVIPNASTKLSVFNRKKTLLYMSSIYALQFIAGSNVEMKSDVIDCFLLSCLVLFTFSIKNSEQCIMCSSSTKRKHLKRTMPLNVQPTCLIMKHPLKKVLYFTDNRQQINKMQAEADCRDICVSLLLWYIPPSMAADRCCKIREFK